MDEEVRQLLREGPVAGGGLAASRRSRDHQVAQHLGVEVCTRAVAHGKGQDVCRGIDPTVADVEPVDLRIIDQEDAQVTGLTGEGLE